MVLLIGRTHAGLCLRSETPAVGDRFTQAFGQNRVYQGVSEPVRRIAGFLRGLFRMCPVWTGRSRGPADLGVIRGLKPVSGAFPGRLGTGVRMTILCNSPLPAVFPRPWCQKKEAPLPARIQITSTHQTGQDLNRMLEKPVQIWTGCPRTPLEPTAGERHAQ